MGNIRENDGYGGRGKYFLIEFFKERIWNEGIGKYFCDDISLGNFKGGIRRVL